LVALRSQVRQLELALQEEQDGSAAVRRGRWISNVAKRWLLVGHIILDQVVV